SDDSEVPNPTGSPKETVEEEKEMSSSEPPNNIDSFLKEALDAPSTSLLEVTVVNTLSAMGSLCLGKL
ncbi:hypothetical protein KI387_027299, partial [Taxus chinensis]